MRNVPPPEPNDLVLSEKSASESAHIDTFSLTWAVETVMSL